MQQQQPQPQYGAPEQFQQQHGGPGSGPMGGAYGDTRPRYESPGSVRDSILRGRTAGRAIGPEGILLTPIRDLTYSGNGDRAVAIRDAAARRAMRYGQGHGELQPYMGPRLRHNRIGGGASQYDANPSGFGSVAQLTSGPPWGTTSVPPSMQWGMQQWDMQQAPGMLHVPQVQQPDIQPPQWSMQQPPGTQPPPPGMQQPQGNHGYGR
jgi:hypothetical protein